jgi:magnesium chelatase family protein
VTSGEERTLAKVLTGAVVALDGALVEIEVDIAPGGMPNFLVVGLPDVALQEARERVRAAIRNSGLAFPMCRITVNLVDSSFWIGPGPSSTCSSSVLGEQTVP